MKINLGCIIEGQGDQLAVPILIRRADSFHKCYREIFNLITALTETA